MRFGDVVLAGKLNFADLWAKVIKIWFFIFKFYNEKYIKTFLSYTKWSWQQDFFAYNIWFIMPKNKQINVWRYLIIILLHFWKKRLCVLKHDLFKMMS